MHASSYVSHCYISAVNKCIVGISRFKSGSGLSFRSLCTYVIVSSRMRVMNHNWFMKRNSVSSAECSRDKPPFSFVRGQSTMCDIVWVSPQGHRSMSVSHHFFLRALQCPCSMQKRFSRD